MGIVVAGAAGRVGSAAARRLLESGADVTAIVRDQGKTASLAAAGARVVQGSLEDEEFVTKATRGADALFWMTPLKRDSDDVWGCQRRQGRIGAAAIRANRIAHVVNLSSAGAQSAARTGLLAGLHDVEEELNAAAENITHLRPGMFYETHLPELAAAQATGRFFAPISPHTAMPHVGAQDVGEVAADELLHRERHGRRVRGVHGPADLSYEVIAYVFSVLLGKKIEFARIPREAAIDALMKAGYSHNAAAAVVETYAAREDGRLVVAELRMADTTTLTTFAEFLRTHMEGSGAVIAPPPAGPTQRPKRRAA
jgi:uncharacterized protein YbjT (DUF2867 family)